MDFRDVRRCKIIRLRHRVSNVIVQVLYIYTRVNLYATEYIYLLILDWIVRPDRTRQGGKQQTTSVHSPLHERIYWLFFRSHAPERAFQHVRAPPANRLARLYRCCPTCRLRFCRMIIDKCAHLVRSRLCAPSNLRCCGQVLKSVPMNTNETIKN